jgi:hypothetical protein
LLLLTNISTKSLPFNYTKKLPNNSARYTDSPELKSLDAQEAKPAGTSDFTSVEKVCTNASNGSLRRYSAENLASQDERKHRACL